MRMTRGHGLLVCTMFLVACMTPPRGEAPPDVSGEPTKKSRAATSRSVLLKRTAPRATKLEDWRSRAVRISAMWPEKDCQGQEEGCQSNGFGFVIGQRDGKL